MELSTGDFAVTEVKNRGALSDELGRLGPREVLVAENDPHRLTGLLEELGLYSTLFESDAFSVKRAVRVLEDHFGVHALDGFGVRPLSAGLAAAGACLLYAQENQRQDLTHVDRLRVWRVEDFMVLDETTKRNLELFRSLRDGGRAGTLISLLDLTATAMGGRKLKHWLGYPLIDRSEVAARHEAVAHFIVDGLRRSDLRRLLAEVSDLERLIGRMTLGRAGPRDFALLRSSLRVLPEVKALLVDQPGMIHDLGVRLDDLADLHHLLETALVDEPPLTLKEGGVFKTGHHPELDEIRAVETDGKGIIARMEASEREKTGIGNLKVGYNRVFGYYIEVTKSHLASVPDDYIRKQTLTGAERFVTPELKEWEDKILTAGERRIELEQELFERLRAELTAQASRMRTAADILARVDVLAAMAEAAVKYDYTRPELLNEDVIEIEGGRHPVIERTLKGEPFVANDVYLDNDSQQVLVITGPNMAGKSTILRQTALIVLMAQMGGFVPADKVRMGLVSRIFTRVGASDDLARGRSTFMVEMNETARILNQADPKSLIILDEIGRGTSTFDGLSIAWAVAEYLHDLAGVGARTLFATHYHELVELAKTKPRLKNFNVAVREYDGRVIFLRKLLPGGTSRSYGLAVARLAGLPGQVLDRAAEVLEGLENGGHRPVPPSGTKGGRVRENDQLELFAAPDDRLVRELGRIDLDQITPLAAMNKLAELKRLT
jgi:DNA mismatch repair protein MutS